MNIKFIHIENPMSTTRTISTQNLKAIDFINSRKSLKWVDGNNNTCPFDCGLVHVSWWADNDEDPVFTEIDKETADNFGSNVYTSCQSGDQFGSADYFFVVSRYNSGKYSGNGTFKIDDWMEFISRVFTKNSIIISYCPKQEHILKWGKKCTDKYLLVKKENDVLSYASIPENIYFRNKTLDITVSDLNSGPIKYYTMENINLANENNNTNNNTNNNEIMSDESNIAISKSFFISIITRNEVYYSSGLSLDKIFASCSYENYDLKWEKEPNWYQCICKYNECSDQRQYARIYNATELLRGLSIIIETSTGNVIYTIMEYEKDPDAPKLKWREIDRSLNTTKKPVQRSCRGNRFSIPEVQQIKISQETAEFMNHIDDNSDGKNYLRWSDYMESGSGYYLVDERMNGQKFYAKVDADFYKKYQNCNLTIPKYTNYWKFIIKYLDGSDHHFYLTIPNQ